MKKRIIALVDCDAFFVSCEQADNKQYKNKPVCVISGKNGCVVSRSKEAKLLGIRMGMPMFMAKKEFPNAEYIVANHEKYHEYSKKVMACLCDFSPDVQIVSIDEAYIDLTGTRKLFGRNYVNIAKLIRETIKEKTDITVSIGISLSKTLAKLASDKAKKHDGIYVIGTRKILSELEITNIEEISGIGKANNLTLRKYGILTGYEFISQSDDWIRSNFGSNGVEMKHELLGEVISKVDSSPKLPKSIQSTSVIGEGIFSDDIHVLKFELAKHLHEACSRLRNNGAKCLCLGVMLKAKDFSTYFDKKNLVRPVALEITLQKTVDELFDKIYRPNVLYRSTGIILERLISADAEQLSLFADTSIKEERLSECIHSLEKKFGKNAVRTLGASGIHND